ncbi:MAG: hypothetical protein RMJ31_03205 [Nitrososphaerota archaeon]|nr:hypothetical protein [Nitrososphaerales archaeon]MDW8044765.1 hypothetical protein [Nitrososphaerota archaeon]
MDPLTLAINAAIISFLLLIVVSMGVVSLITLINRVLKIFAKSEAK